VLVGTRELDRLKQSIPYDRLTYEVVLGLLRFFLALSIVNIHSQAMGISLLPGDVAVQSFFMISGFYMALVLNEKYLPEKYGESTYRIFISNRILRLAPTYFIVLLFTIIFTFIFWVGFKLPYGPSKWLASLYHNGSTFSTNLVLVFAQLTVVGQDVTNFLSLNAHGGLNFVPSFPQEQNQVWRYLFVPQAWTLSLELYFYLLAPFLVKRSIRFILGFIAISLVVRFAVAYIGGLRMDPWSHRFFPFELAFFLAGALAYRAYRSYKNDGFMIKVFIGMLGLSGVMAYASMFGRVMKHPLSLLTIIFIGLVLLFTPYLFQKTKNSRIDRYLGELSYPMYICHLMIIWFFGALAIPNGLWRSVGIFSLVILCSAGLYQIVDRRVDDYRQHRLEAKGVLRRGRPN
jgi:peptidoglycan/LPS O-acetylase OafA/YrhL